MVRLACGRVLLVAAAGCNAAFGIDDTVLETSNPRTMVFRNSESTVDLVDFPVLVPIDATRIAYGEVTSPATDLRFHDPVTDVDLPFDVDTWNPAGESTVWVRIPRIHAGSTTDAILMFYGADAHGLASGPDVWRDYQLVLHGSPGDFNNAAGAAYRGVDSGITTINGPIGSAYGLQGSGEHLITLADSGALFDGWQQFTLELWMYVDVANAAQLTFEPRFLDKGPALHLGRLFKAAGLEGFVDLQIDLGLTSTTVTAPQIVPLRRWFHFVYAFEGHNLWLYRNGIYVDVMNFTSPQALVADANPVVLGATNDALQGGLDEIRFSRTYHDPDWVFAQELSMTGQFVRFVTPGSTL